MASSHDATGPCDLLQGLVAGTSPIVCADLKESASTVWELLFCLRTESLTFQHSGSSVELHVHVGSINARDFLQFREDISKDCFHPLITGR